MRNVYFDPYGSFTQGYDTGAQREQSIQHDTRVARREDMMLPLEYRSAQRDDALGQFAVPYRQRAIQQTDQLGQDSVFNSGQRIRDNYAQWSGVAAPGMDAYNNYFGIHASYNGQPQPQQQPPAQPPAITDPAHSGAYNAFTQWTTMRGPSLTPEARAQGAAHFAAQYGIAPEQLLNPPAPTAGAAPPYQQYTNPSHPDQMVNPAYYPQAAAPQAAAPPAITQYGIQPTAPQQPMGPQSGMVTYTDAYGRVVGMQSDPRMSYLNNVNYDRQVKSAATQYGYQTDAYDQQLKARELQRNEEYNAILREQLRQKLLNGPDGTAEF